MNKSISEELKEILVTVFWFCAFVAAVWSLYIGMVLEPDCERKGFAGVDSKGCWIIQDNHKIYEKQ